MNEVKSTTNKFFQKKQFQKSNFMHLVPSCLSSFSILERLSFYLFLLWVSGKTFNWLQRLIKPWFEVACTTQASSPYFGYRKKMTKRNKILSRDRELLSLFMFFCENMSEHRNVYRFSSTLMVSVLLGACRTVYERDAFFRRHQLGGTLSLWNDGLTTKTAVYPIFLM
jgi:hypothetical protein